MVLDTNIDTSPEPDGTGEDYIAQVRERLRQVMLSQSLSLSQVAKLSAIGQSTVAAFQAATYAGDNRRIADKVRLWLDQREMLVRTKGAAPNTIPYTETRTAKAFSGALEYAQSLADCVVIVGGPGVGKSATLTQYAANRANVWMITVDPSNASLSGVLDCLCDKIGVAETMMKRRGRAIIARVRDTQGLIVVDEAQNLTNDSVELLRAIHDQAQIGLALAGNQKVWSRIDGGGRKEDFAQLFSRVGARVTAQRPTASDIEDLLNAGGIQDAASRKLLKAIASKPGALRQMVKTLRLARMVALGAEEELTADHIAHAYSRLTGTAEGS